jgi:phosphopantetheinyl transferase
MTATCRSADNWSTGEGAWPRGLEVWCVDLDAAGPAICRAWQGLSGVSLARAQGPDVDDLSSAHADPFASRKAAADAALRCLLSAHVGIDVACQPFARGPKGKPSIAGSPVHFSLSHSEGLAVLAICDGAPVGIDVEVVRSVSVSEHRRKQLEDAAEALSGHPLSPDSPLRFLQAWVRLEAAAKATGEGIGALLTRMLPDRSPTETLPATDAPAITVHDIALPDPAAGVAALAVIGARAVPAISVFPREPADIARLIAARSARNRDTAGLQGTEDQRSSSPTAMLATYSGPSEWTSTRPRRRPLRV